MVAVFVFFFFFSLSLCQMVDVIRCPQKKWSLCFAVSKNDRRVSVCICGLRVSLCPRVLVGVSALTHSRRGEGKHFVLTMSGGHILAQKFVAIKSGGQETTRQPKQPSDDNFLSTSAGIHNVNLLRHCAYPPSQFGRLQHLCSWIARTVACRRALSSTLQPSKGDADKLARSSRAM